MIVPATPKHIQDMYPDMPSVTMRAYAMVEGERTLAVAGVYLTNGTLVAFANGTEEACRRKRECIYMARKVMPLMMNKRVFALKEDIPTSEGFLRHFNFQPFEGDIWIRGNS